MFGSYSTVKKSALFPPLLGTGRALVKRLVTGLGIGDALCSIALFHYQQICLQVRLNSEVQINASTEAGSHVCKHF